MQPTDFIGLPRHAVPALSAYAYQPSFPLLPAGLHRRELIIRYTDGTLELTEAGAEAVGDCPPAMKDEIAAEARWIDAGKPAALIGSGAVCADGQRCRFGHSGGSRLRAPSAPEGK